MLQFLQKLQLGFSKIDDKFKILNICLDTIDSELFVFTINKCSVDPGDVKKFPVCERCSSNGTEKMCGVAIKFFVILVLQVLWVKNLVSTAAKIIGTIIMKEEDWFLYL